MDYDTIKVWLQIINMVGTFGLGCWLYLEKRSDKTNERIDVLADKVDQLDKAVSSLQTATNGAPNHHDLSKVYDSVNRLAEKVNVVAGEIRAWGDTLRIIQNHMLSRGGSDR